MASELNKSDDFADSVTAVHDAGATDEYLAARWCGRLITP
jgi:hypothetical protein